MTKLNLLAFIYSIYLCSTIYIGAVPIGNHQNHFDGILLQKRLQILQQKHQQHYQQRNKYMNAALGTIKRGRPTSKDTIPTYMLDLYKYLSKHKDSKILHDGNTVRSYFDTESGDVKQNEEHYKFRINDINPDKQILKKAELRIFKLANINHRSLHAYVQINIINRFDGKVVSSKLMGTKSHGWLTFPITDIVEKWIRNPELNNGIRINIKTIYGDGRTSIDFATKYHHHREPILVVYMQQQNVGLDSILDMDIAEKKLKIFAKKSALKQIQHRRQRRSINLHQYLKYKQNKIIKEQTNDTCQLRPLKVDLSIIEARKDIVLPYFLEINQCVGTCKSGLMHKKDVNATNHAIFQALYSVFKDNVKLPCCAPATFKNQVILKSLNGGEKIQIENLEKTIATSCSCL